jgi:hypothetical protein
MALKVAAGLITPDIGVPKFEPHRTDIGMLELDGPFATTGQVLEQLLPMRRLVVGLAREFPKQHAHAVGNDQFHLVTPPVLARHGMQRFDVESECRQAANHCRYTA